MVAQYHYGSVERNPLTSGYSVYVGMWSVIFVESWKRKEIEFGFLWGSETLTGNDAVRPQFKGKTVVTDYGRERYVYSSEARHVMRQVVGFGVVWFMIVLTVVSALGASIIKGFHVPGQEGYTGIFEDDFKEGGDPGPAGCQPDVTYHTEHPCGFLEQNYWKFASSLLNLFIIQVPTQTI